MMDLRIGPEHADFVWGEKLAGRYHYRDRYKPHLHPLNTPGDHTLTLLSPHDHKHHKGLMYALRIEGVNFWEEHATERGEVLGRQRHEKFDPHAESDESVGFMEHLTWLELDQSTPVFAEERSLSCRILSERHAYEWTWSTDLEAQRELTLIMSQWSRPNKEGVRVNYHGLGMRLRRDFGCTGGNELWIDEASVPFESALGKMPGQVVFYGSLDGTWPVERAGVGIKQFQPNALFVTESPFAFLGLGPSNLKSLHLKEGQRISEEYSITVFDHPKP